MIRSEGTVEMLQFIKVGWAILLAILGATTGAVLMGGLSSIPLTIPGGIIGRAVGYLLGLHIPIWEWFS